MYMIDSLANNPWEILKFFEVKKIFQIYNNQFPWITFSPLT